MLSKFGLSVGMPVVVLFCLAANADGASAVSRAKQADRLYQESRYEEALKRYDEALSLRPEDPVIQYNRASAFYRKREFAKALNAFLASFGAGEERIEAPAIYNAGNSRFRMGEAEEKPDPQSAMSNYKEAAEFYRKGIELCPQDDDVKYNYEFTLKKIRELEERQKEKEQQQQKEQQKEQQKGQQKGQEKEQQKQQQKEQQKEREKEQQKEKEKENDQEQEQQQRDEQKEERKEQDGKEQEDERRGRAPEPGDENRVPESAGPDTMERPEGRMTEEEANMMLRGQEEEEAEMRAAMRKKKAAGRPQVLKNW